VKRVLFVDDEPHVLDGLRRMLRPLRDEWRMSFATDGPAALRLLDAEPVDVIVSDMRMPGMDGASLLAAVCDRHPAVERIILSGYTDLDASLRAVTVAHQFLLKPCDPAMLRRAIDGKTGVPDTCPSSSVADLIGAVRTLPATPRAYEAFRDAVAAGEPAIDRLVEVITQDVGISARILQLTNSGFFGQRSDTVDVRTAVSALGVNVLRQLVATVGAFRPLNSGDVAPGFHIEALQRHCQLTGMIATRLTTDAPQPTLFMAGFLHDVGKLVLAHGDPARFSRALTLAEATGRAPHAVEAELFGLSHAEVGACLLGLWGFPDTVVEAVACHHHPERIPTERGPATISVYLANLLAHGVDQPRAGEPAAAGSMPKLDATLLTALGGSDLLPSWLQMAGEVAARYAQV
jgi:HD-like signal output (HDOD) protein/ActR/RegA family two-component response regulator